MTEKPDSIRPRGDWREPKIHGRRQRKSADALAASHAIAYGYAVIIEHNGQRKIFTASEDTKRGYSTTTTTRTK